jgi:hypothetical protein
VAAILIGIFAIAKTPVNARYKDAFREQVVIKGLESVLQNMDFRPAECLDEAIIKASGLFRGYNTYNGNDFLAAEYKGIPFTQSDVHLAEEHEETYTDRDGDVYGWIEADTRFHIRMHNACDNPFLLEFLERLQRHFDSVSLLIVPAYIQKNKKAANDEHRDMIRHIGAGDGPRAREVARLQRTRVRGFMESVRNLPVASVPRLA